MIEKNPQPELGMIESYYISHLMRMMSMMENGVIPINKIYEYCQFWGIDQPLEFGEIIVACVDYISKHMK